MILANTTTSPAVGNLSAVAAAADDNPILGFSAVGNGRNWVASPGLCNGAINAMGTLATGTTYFDWTSYGIFSHDVFVQCQLHRNSCLALPRPDDPARHHRRWLCRHYLALHDLVDRRRHLWRGRARSTDCNQRDNLRALDLHGDRFGSDLHRPLHHRLI